jgi:glycosyltransferase involved in cell wall biosynthesis
VANVSGQVEACHWLLQSVVEGHMSRRNVVRVLVIGQTPPPYGGQAIMIAHLAKANYDDIKIYHVRMNYSRSISDIGRIKIRKFFHLFRILFESVYKTIRHNIDVICYPPGAQKTPLLRDIVTLFILRRLRRKLVLMFHASGLSEEVSHWKGILLWIFQRAFFFPDAAVQTSYLNPPDGAFVKAKNIYIVPNGMTDQFERFCERKAPNAVPIILYVGIIREDKGIDVLIEAAAIMKKHGKNFRVKVVGQFTSQDYYNKVLDEQREKGLDKHIEFPGLKVGDEKWMLYGEADIFCFPSYFASESFGNVIIEAMMFELPVVSTRWRGIPSVVEEGVTGFLVDIKNAPMLAESLERLLNDQALRINMGYMGRQSYLEKFTIDKYLEGIGDVLRGAGAAN